jgi:chromosome segregation ATPase
MNAMKTFRVAMQGMFAAAVIAAATLMLSAQSKDPDSVQVLKDLVAEVRGLRVAVERQAGAQVQTQLLTSVLSVQQSRIADLTARLEIAARELRGLQDRARNIASEIEAMETGRITDSALPFQSATPAERRAKFEEALNGLKRELERIQTQQLPLQTRESELSSVLSAEEAKWNDLRARLDAWLGHSRP